MPGSATDVVEMAVMGLDTSIVAPVLILISRTWRGWRLFAWPAPFALCAFVTAHAALTVWMAVTMPALAADLVLHLALVFVSFVFWLPVIGPHRPLADAGRCVYLFLAMPAMDLAGVYVVLHGDSAGGLSMIVAMLPVGITAVVLTWRWLLAEELNVDDGRSPAPDAPSGRGSLAHTDCRTSRGAAVSSPAVPEPPGPPVAAA